MSQRFFVGLKFGLFPGHDKHNRRVVVAESNKVKTSRENGSGMFQVLKVLYIYFIKTSEWIFVSLATSV